MANSIEFSLQAWGEKNEILPGVIERLRDNNFISKRGLKILGERYPKADPESTSRLAQFFGIDELHAILLQEALLTVSPTPAAIAPSNTSM